MAHLLTKITRVGWRHSEACTNPNGKWNDKKEATVLAYQYLEDINTCNEDVIEATFQADLKHLGMNKVTLHKTIYWDYFPHFNNDAISAGYPWKMFENQGINHSWYIDSSTCFESINALMNYNHKLMDHC